MSRRGPGTSAFVVSAALHGVLLVPLVVLARPPQAIQFETVKVNLVSPPPTDEAEPESEPAAAPQPEPEPAPVEQAPEPEAQLREEPPPEPEREDIEKPEMEKPPETPPQPRPQPRQSQSEAEPNVGGENLNVATEGREFPYPEYIGNVIVQVNRYFRWSQDSRPKAVIYFEILEDGSVRNMRITQPSGNFRFDLAVQGAVETAGNRGAFGPLPEGYAGGFLPVQLEVEPPR